MSNMRTTRILAAGKSVRRPTPEDRLKRKMEARAAAAAARSTPSPAAAPAGEATAPPTTTASGRSVEHGGGKPGDDAKGGGTQREGGGAANGGGMSPGKTGNGRPTIEGSLNEHGRGRSAPTNDDSSRGDRREDCGRTHGLSRLKNPANETTDNKSNATGGDAGARGPSERYTADGDKKRLLRPSKPGAEEALLRGVREGPLRDALAALLTSTVMDEDGGRVLAPTFPSISALCELKYSEPIGPPQASAVERVILVRCVLSSLLKSIDRANRLTKMRRRQCVCVHARIFQVEPIA